MADTENEVAVKALIRTKYLAATLLLESEKRQHGKILRDLENNYMKGEKNYPKYVLAAFNYLTNYQGERRNVGFCSEDLHFTNMSRKKITEADGNHPPL